jgi:mannosyltransferase OCH1-like enzyme
MKTQKNNKNIFQICIGLNGDHPLVKKSRDKMIALNPDYNYTMITKEIDMDNFVKDYFLKSKNEEEKKWAEAYFKIPQVVEAATQTTVLCSKIDVARLMLIYKLGGLYLDMDTQFHYSLSKITKDKSCVVFIYNRSHGDLDPLAIDFCPDKFYCVKNNSVYKKAISNICSNIFSHIELDKPKVSQLCSFTGPAVINNTIKNICEENNYPLDYSSKPGKPSRINEKVEGADYTYKGDNFTFLLIHGASRCFNDNLYWDGKREHWNPNVAKGMKIRASKKKK